MMPSLPESLRTAAAIAAAVDGELRGPAELPVTGLELVDRAVEGHLTFIGEASWAERWGRSAATCVLVSRGIDLPALEPSDRRGTVAVILVEDADAAMLRLLERIDSAVPPPAAGIHSTAAIDPSAAVDPSATIGPLCSIAASCSLAAGVVLHAGVHLGEGVSIGAGSVLHSGVTVRARSEIGARCILHDGCVVGSDGFGYRPGSAGLVKVPHIGFVRIEDEVEIGANTCIDRGKFGATLIGRGTKIDNLCQIAHNCRIGRHCALSGLVGLAGTVTIGDGTRIGGGTGVADHVTIGRGCTIAAQSGVMNDIPDGETWAGYPAQERTAAMREAVALRRLPELAKRLRQLAGGS
jgi:UDP-3-O-[3-hydroxymyristoyl] glucosamine N-acyltransferase